MAYGRVSVILGAQAGLGAIIQYGEALRTGGLAGVRVPPMAMKNRLSEAEVMAVLGQLVQLVKLLTSEQIEVSWTLMGASPQLELPMLAQVLGLEISSRNIETFDECIQQNCDALIYVPLDVQQPRQVEQLARLSMVLPRMKHVAFAPAPKWNHAQLMALRETWEWLDPKAAPKIMNFAESLISINGGITKKDLAKIDLPKSKASEDVWVGTDSEIITRNSKMKEVLGLVDTVADTDSTILITGDSGTGKELVAQRIHRNSHRANGPLVVVNCGAIPEELLESELFGHVKGAFTGAVSNRDGRFQVAEGGTLFLDEIGEMGPNLQVKLLRVLQSRKFEPVGSTKTLNANVRIIAATHRDLEKEVAEGRFREDLFYRLNVIPIHIPALKERREDIQVLVDHFAKKFNREKARRVTGVTRASLRALVAYAWPGNVRELENLMERMVILKSSGMIDVLDFPEKYRRVSLSEIEFDDLMGIGRASPNTGTNQQNSSGGGVNTLQHGTPNTVSMGQVQNFHDERSGENSMMKITGTNFSNIQKTGSETNRQSEVGSTGSDGLENSSRGLAVGPDIMMPESVNGFASTGVSGEESMSFEQALRIIADKAIFPNEGLDFNSIVDQFENILILQALERTGWNRNRAAGLLRLNRTTLVEKLKKKQLLPPLRYGGGILEGNA